MTQRDSIDKIAQSYFACVTTKRFRYKGEVYDPHPLQVSPLLLRGYTCPVMCGGCCPRFSLDYLPSERSPPGSPLKPRFVEFNSKPYVVLSDLQIDHTDHHCRNLNKSDGRCNIHGKHPFSCDFELIRFIRTSGFRNKNNYLNQRLFGRGWAFLRVDGERGARCEMLPPTEETISEVVRKLGRLKQWCNYFEIKHKVDPIIKWVQGPHSTNPLDDAPLKLSAGGKVR